jgi:hypothetical protein
LVLSNKLSLSGDTNSLTQGASHMKRNVYYLVITIIAIAIVMLLTSKGAEQTVLTSAPQPDAMPSPLNGLVTPEHDKASVVITPPAAPTDATPTAASAVTGPAAATTAPVVPGAPATAQPATDASGNPVTPTATATPDVLAPTMQSGQPSSPDDVPASATVGNEPAPAPTVPNPSMQVTPSEGR